MQSELTQDTLKTVLRYDQETGQFFWISGTCKNKMAGNLEGNGYVRINFGGKKYQAHRLAWLYMTGMWPTDMIDHVDGVRSNNRWSNLRPANRVENMRNSRRYSTNTSGYKGVSKMRNTTSKQWVAQCRVNKKSVCLGFFKTAEEAAAAYNTFAAETFGPYFRGNTIEDRVGV